MNDKVNWSTVETTLMIVVVGVLALAMFAVQVAIGKHY
jgi:hypothetical protein